MFQITNSDLIVNEQYKFEITHVSADQGTYRITKLSNQEIIGDYQISTQPILDVIPGVSIIINSTYIDNPAKPGNSLTKEGDYLVLSLFSAKCHVDPTLSMIPKITSFDDNFTLNVENNNYSSIGTVQSIDDITKWPILKDTIQTTNNFSNLTYKLKIFENGTQVNADLIFDKLYVNVVGKVNDIDINNNVSLYDSNDTNSISANEYNFIDTITGNNVLGIESLKTNDNFNFNIQYILKNDNTLNSKNILMRLEVYIPDTDNDVKLLSYANNFIFIRNNIQSKQVDNQDVIFKNLIKNIRISDVDIVNSLMGITNYAITISNLHNNEITIVDLTNHTTLGTYSTNKLTSFINAIPGISFDLYSFSETLGLNESYATTNIVDDTGATVIVTLIPGVINNDVPNDDVEYYISYKYLKDDEDYEPKLFTEYNDILNEYGDYIITASGSVLNSLSLGSKIAIKNGALPLICVQVESDTDEGYYNAIDKLSKKIGSIDNVNIIVPLTSSINVCNYLSQHVIDQSSSINCKFRMGYVAADLSEQIDKSPTINDMSQGSIQKASGLNNERMVYVVPGGATMSEQQSNGNYLSKTLPGYFLAAACGAIAIKNDPAEPLTNKVINGFDNLITYYTEDQMNLLAQNGCLVLKQESNVISIRHGITTHYSTNTIADIQSNEITCIQIKDYVIMDCKLTLNSLYIGGKFKPTIMNDIKYTLTQIFAKETANEIIMGVDNLSVSRDAGIPTKININFMIEAIYPLNYIDINFGFSTENL